MKKSDVKNRLLVSNATDPAINTKKKTSRKLIDLKNYVNEKALNEWLWNEEQTELELEIPDVNELQETLTSFTDAPSFIEYCFDNNIVLSKTTIDNLNKNFKTNSPKIIADICKKSTVINNIFIRIQSEANKIQQEENIYPLYVASHYLSGVDLEGMTINAPLLLWEVSIVIKNNKIKLVKNEELPTLNEKLNFFLKYTYSIQIDDNTFTTTQDIYKYEELLNRICTFKFSKEFVKFNDYQKDDKAAFKYTPSCVLTLVEPTGGLIKQDIETILSSGDDPFAINNQLINNDEDITKIIESDNLIELNRPLNIYQKYAVHSALKTNTLIFGPPGTGKSETTASLIGNIIFNGKNILMVSEKMAALEVLEQRLGKLAEISLFAFKAEHKDKFYASLIAIHNALSDASHPCTVLESLKVKNQAYLSFKNEYGIINTIEKNMQEKFQDLTEKIFAYYVNTTDEIKKTHLTHNDLFININNLFPNTNDLWTVYPQLNSLKEILIKHQEIIKRLPASFKLTKEVLDDFLSTYKNNDNPNWMLTNFLNDRTNWKKKKLFGGKTKDPELYLLFLEDIANYLNLYPTTTTLNGKQLEKIVHLMVYAKNENDYHSFLSTNLIDYLLPNYQYNEHNIQLLNKKLQTTRKIMAADCSEDMFNLYIRNLKNTITKNHLEDQVNKVISKAYLKRRPNINRLIKENYAILRILFPIWVLNPNQTCILTPCQKGIFDYGIFDEASQMFVERAYPLVYRCKISVVAGDDKQLQPTSFFLKKTETDENEDEYELGDSLFEQANVCLWPKYYLKNHYRSDSSELIAFSNQYLYNDELEFSTKNKKILPPIITYNVNGIWENRSNVKEIEKVMQILKEIDCQKYTILIITFNQQQAMYLENEFVDNFGGTDIFNRYLEGNIKIRALENVQGDEADIAIISVSYGKDKNGKMKMFFGPLSQQNGINRLNVAITRSRKEMIIVKSMSGKDIQKSINENNNILKYFLDYVDNFCDNKPSTFTPSTQFNNSLEEDVFNELDKRIDKNKYQITTQFTVGKKKINIAIIDKATQLVKLGVDVDQTIYHSPTRTILENIDWENFLEDLGYSIYRIIDFEWKLNKLNVINDMMKNL